MNASPRTLLTLLAIFVASQAQAMRWYSPNTGRWFSRDPIGAAGGPNAYGFAANDAINGVDMLGLLAASVVSITIDEGSHLSVEKNGTPYQYIAPRIKDLPPKASESKLAASITALIDESFNEDIRAWTMLSRDKAITALQLSTDLHGKVTVSCPCPFARVRANWGVSAVLAGPNGNAEAIFDDNGVRTAWNKPSASRSGTINKTLDSSYRATFRFVLGQSWYDTSKTAPTTSHVNIHASFDCTD